MANLPSFFAFLSATKKNLSEEYDQAINSASISENRSSPSRNCWTRTLYIVLTDSQ